MSAMTPHRAIPAIQTALPVAKLTLNPHCPMDLTDQRPASKIVVQTILPNMLTSAPCMSLIDLPPPCNGIERTAMTPDNGDFWK
jgi:hypothetical protein